MLPSDAAAALAADGSLGIMLDRRDLTRGRSLPADLRIVSCIELGARGAGVCAAVVTAADGGDLPKRDSLSAPDGQVRLMDRFYLPAIRNASVVTPMFDMIASLYDAFTDTTVNLATASLLLEAVLVHAPSGAPILDFGCGTGVAVEALKLLGSEARLLGVDVSTGMLSRAQQRGLSVISIESWRSAPPQVGGAIANFVLHYGVPDDDLARIARSLLPGSVFCANLFGPEPDILAKTVQVLTACGLVHDRQFPITRPIKPDLMLSFRKPS